LFQIHLGGHIGHGARFGVKLSRRVRVENAKYYIENIVRTFHAERWPGETFADYVAREEPERLERLDETQRVKEVFV
jgi:sulfite reductase (ferredoxin)